MPDPDPADQADLVALELIQQRILVLRGEKVLLDEDLARMYGVETRILNRAVQRNLERFPVDFMFQLSPDEAANLKSQFGISSGWGGRRRMPFAFTEQGVAMLSSVLRSARAVQVNVAIMRAFVQLRRWLASQEELAQRVAELEAATAQGFSAVFAILDQLRSPAPSTQRRIGFKDGEGGGVSP